MLIVVEEGMLLNSKSLISAEPCFWSNHHNSLHIV
jgi:hypothetical protein